MKDVITIKKEAEDQLIFNKEPLKLPKDWLECFDSYLTDLINIIDRYQKLEIQLKKAEEKLTKNKDTEGQYEELQSKYTNIENKYQSKVKELSHIKQKHKKDIDSMDQSLADIKDKYEELLKEKKLFKDIIVKETLLRKAAEEKLVEAVYEELERKKHEPKIDSDKIIEQQPKFEKEFNLYKQQIAEGNKKGARSTQARICKMGPVFRKQLHENMAK